MAPLAVAANDTSVGACKEHPEVPAVGKCLTCGTLVCETCGGVVGNKGLYCLNHTPAITSATGGSPGMNPMLGGPGARAVAARRQSNSGMVGAILGAVGLIALFVVLFLFPGILRSKELPPSPGAAGMPGGSPYGAASPYGPPGMPGMPGGDPYGSPAGPGGPPGMPPGAMGGPSPGGMGGPSIPPGSPK
jgi:hypothetical protein